MAWSKQQIKKHKENFEVFREKYTQGENGVAQISQIQNDKRRCATLINRISAPELVLVRNELKDISGFYHQEIPHFTIDCHRYLIEDKLPAEINSLSLREQGKIVMNDEELVSYKQILKEVIEKEVAYPIELKGVAIGGDGLIAQVWYEDERLQNFSERLGERVRKEIETMDFQWGIVKNKVPIRVVNLTRFTGKESKEKVVEYVEKNKDRKIGELTMGIVDLVVSDHYIQKNNTSKLGRYHFKD